MATKRAIKGWSWEDYEDSVHPTEEAAIEDFRFWHSDDEDEVTLYGFAAVVPDAEAVDEIAAEVGDFALELLHDRYGEPGEFPDIPDAIADAARTFTRKAIKHFEVKQLEVVTEKTVPLTARHTTGEG